MVVQSVERVVFGQADKALFNPLWFVFKHGHSDGHGNEVFISADFDKCPDVRLFVYLRYELVSPAVAQ